MISTVYLSNTSPIKSDPDTQTDEQVADRIRTKPPHFCIDHVHASKVKSSLCRNFEAKGCCPYGQRCQFAHGPEELRCNETINTSYKTKPCFNFLKNGYCHYGKRCNYVHYESKKIENYRFSKIVLNFPEMTPIIGGAQSKFTKKFLGLQRL